MSCAPFIVRSYLGGQAAVATRRIAAGENVFSIVVKNDHLVSKPSRYTVQISEQHVDFGDMLSGSEYLNHSCEPNCVLRFLNTKAEEEYSSLVIKLDACTDVKEGDAITFDYHSTEASLCCPFECHCGSSNCVGTVKGALHLPSANKQELLNKASTLPGFLSPKVRTLLSKGNEGTR